MFVDNFAMAHYTNNTSESDYSVGARLYDMVLTHSLDHTVEKLQMLIKKGFSLTVLHLYLYIDCFKNSHLLAFIGRSGEC